MIRLLIIFSIILFNTSLLAQQNVDSINNDTVLELKTTGFSNEIIKSKIQNSYCNFDLTTKALISLKNAGISDDIITLMLTRVNNVTNIKITDNSKIVEEPNKGVEPGVYYCKGMPCNLIELEASVYSQSKTGSGIATALSYGIAKTKAKATLSGASANLILEELKPTFYFYFVRNSGNNFGSAGTSFGWFTSATSPNEFILVKFEVTKKAREVVTGSWSTYSGMSSGIDDDNKIEFKYEKISPGVYRVYTEKPLVKGQYCFMYAGSSSTTTTMYGGAPMQKVYDFAIK